jgi:signal transduction histidine kinase
MQSSEKTLNRSLIQQKLSSFESVDFYFFLLRLLTIVGGALYYIFTAREYSAYQVFAWFFPLYVAYSVALYGAILRWPSARRVIYLMTLLVDLGLICLLILYVGLFVGSFYIGFYLLVAIHSFYFGLRVGLAAAVLASSSYWAIYVFLGGLSFIPWPDFVVRIGFLFMIALSLGLISESEKRQKEHLAEALKQARQAIRLNEEFLGTLSHDVRTPLTSVVGYADLLLGENYGPISSAQQAPLKSIIKGAESLLALFNRLLELSKVKAGDIQLKVEAFDMDRLLEEMIRYFRPVVSNPHVELKDYVAGQPVMVETDRTLVCHVVTNLITNALKYTERGHVQVSLLNGNRADSVRIVVEDTGIGIKADEIDSIFDEFKRGSSPSALSKPGVGLGLAIVKRSVGHLGGTIHVESVYGQGSKFFVTLPKHF